MFCSSHCCWNSYKIAFLTSTLTLVKETSGGLGPSGEGLRVGRQTKHIERLSSVLGHWVVSFVSEATFTLSTCQPSPSLLRPTFHLPKIERARSTCIPQPSHLVYMRMEQVGGRKLSATPSILSPTSPLQLGGTAWILPGKRVGPDPLFVSEFGAGFLGRRWR